MKKYLTDSEVAARYGVSRPTVWRWVGKGSFLAPIQLSDGCSRWDITDLESWEADKKSAEYSPRKTPQ